MIEKKRAMQIVVPLVILALIGGIWLWKNNPFAPAASGSGEPLEVTEMDMEDLTSRGIPTILDFGSESCGPCRAMAPDLEEIHREMEGKAVIRYTDVWAYPENGENLPIQVVPTQFFFHADGSPYQPSEELIEEIGFIQYSLRDTDEHVYTVHEGMLTADQMRLILQDMGVEP